MSAGAPWWKVASVWLARIVAGGAFAVAGWAKLVDPQGFVLKISEYLNVWHIDGVIPRDIVVIGAVALSLFELIVGVLLFTGSLRRSSAVGGLLMMAFMLPLTAYIAVADPVADCGCFGDFWVLSNTATLLKNVILTNLLILCFVWYKAARPIYRPGLQWLVITLTAVYGLTVAIIGWQLQPIVDFRPYGIGKTLVNEDAGSDIMYTYVKGGIEQDFALDALPDSTWTFVEQASGSTAADELSVFDADGNDVTFDLFDPQQKGEMVVFAVAEPGVDNLIRSRMSNEIAEYAASKDIATAGIVAASGPALEQWIEMAAPEFEVYSAADTGIRQLVRGSTGIVYMRDGRVVWKRNFATLPADLLSYDAPLENVAVVDDGRVAAWLSGFFAAGLLLLYGISALTKIELRPKRASKAL